MKVRSFLQAFLACLIVVMSTGCSPSSEQISANVKDSMQRTLSSDPNFVNYFLTVQSVSVVQENGNRYQGIAIIKTKNGHERQVSIQVTADGQAVLWKTEPGAFLFLAQEELERENVSPAPETALDRCVAAKVAAFRKHQGAEAVIIFDVLEEWRSECSSQN